MDPGTARQQIDEEIAQLGACIITLKTTRNTFTPFARLHPEIIQEIFVLVSRGAEHRQIGKTALLISWVCHHWRELGQQTSTLWSCIDFFNPTWVEAALSRTRNRPLEFSIFRPSERHGESSRYVPLCLSNLARISSLSLSANSGTELNRETSLSPLWATPAPLLVKLDLGAISLPRNLFAGSSSTLQKLSLSSCDFDWESLPVHQGLRYLDISQPVSRTSVDDLMRKLQVIAHQVESLYFFNVLLPLVTTSESGHHSPKKRQEFAKMKSFSMHEEDGPSVTYILNRLSLPSHLDHTGVTLLDHREEQFDTARALVSCRGIEKWPVERVEIELQDEYIGIVMRENWNTDFAEIQVVEETEGSDCEDQEVEGTENSDCEYQEEDQAEDTDSRQVKTVSYHMEIFDDIPDIIPIFDIFPFRAFKRLTFNGSHNPDRVSALTNCLDAKGAIEELNVITFFVPTFTSIIYKQNEQIQDIIRHDGPFEGLEMNDDQRDQCRSILTFHHLTTLVYYGEHDDNYPFEYSYFEVLWEWLKWRQLVGLGVKVLVFQTMKIPPEAYLTELYDDVVEAVEFIRVVELTGEFAVEPFDINPNA
ncbi:hypothetical protein BDN72DRAFT_880197 [Pluteus cervinus]|uniref:Uncharacterized protein n=1 Tax=Pluteus cervinus TaxID=181527 RepID=A0ACD3ALG0_9AGAR|nr:hypothetical protein BDN72DRAFT_880197 [Pluteus cervinus]